MKEPLSTSATKQLETAYRRLDGLSSMTDVQRLAEMFRFERIASDLRAAGTVMRGQRVIGDGRLLESARLLRMIRETNGSSGSIRAARAHIACVLGLSEFDDVTESVTA